MERRAAESNVTKPSALFFLVEESAETPASGVDRQATTVNAPSDRR